MQHMNSSKCKAPGAVRPRLALVPNALAHRFCLEEKQLGAPASTLGTPSWAHITQAAAEPRAARQPVLQPPRVARRMPLGGLLLLLALFSIGVEVARAQTNLIISEFLADNTRSIKDTNGTFADWIEIHNPTTNTVSMKNW